MSFDTEWDIEKYRDDHESEEQWELRKSFMEKWKNDYPEGRLICLARVFINVELMGCRYPAEVMQEVSRMSSEVAKSYRESKKTKLQRTFVSASDAAEDRAKGVKRKGGIPEDGPSQSPKTSKINFVPASKDEPQSSTSNTDINGSTIGSKVRDNTSQLTSKKVEEIDLVSSQDDDSSNTDGETDDSKDDAESKTSNTNTKTDTPAAGSKSIHSNTLNDSTAENSNENNTKSGTSDVKTKFGYDSTNVNEYMEQLKTVPVINPRYFSDHMFQTRFGRLVLLARPWMSPIGNIQASCAMCTVSFDAKFNGVNACTVVMDGLIVATGAGSTKAESRSLAGGKAWEILKKECVTVVVKEQFIAKDDSRISSEDVSGTSGSKIVEQSSQYSGFGTPVVSSVASKMMKLMGWQGGGLGAKAEGISEPIMPHLHQVRRAGLGGGVLALRRAALALMRRYSLDESALDVDLVFANDFTKAERATLHVMAKQCRLVSRSYGKDSERFLVVRKKVDPYSLVRAIVHKGGSTPKYQIFIPQSLNKR